MRNLLLASALLALASTPLPATPRLLDDWSSIVDAAQGQTVYWHEWGVDPRINAFIVSVGEDLHARYGVTLEHVRLADTADAVTRVLLSAQPLPARRGRPIRCSRPVALASRRS
jgi:putative thiamine transport system substrate-binding protein